jgi:uncharacterized protein with FMN-binding domain
MRVSSLFHLYNVYSSYSSYYTTGKVVSMSRKQATQTPDFVRKIKEFFLSAFVVLTFLAYIIHERSTNSASASNTSNTTANNGAVPTVTAQTQGVAYKNGTYTGPSVDAYYGLVQVKVIIQNGKIADVQFLDYPHDRRTSQEINTQVMPWLTQEAIQAQSANVDIISGATLTSEAFATSLQSALQSAKN